MIVIGFIHNLVFDRFFYNKRWQADETILPTAVRDNAESLKSSHKTGGVRNLLKISAPLPLIRTFRMSLLLARSIWVDCTFKSVQQDLAKKA
jgi:hypothetical protein